MSVSHPPIRLPEQEFGAVHVARHVYSPMCFQRACHIPRVNRHVQGFGLFTEATAFFPRYHAVAFADACFSRSEPDVLARTGAASMFLSDVRTQAWPFSFLFFL